MSESGLGTGALLGIIIAIVIGGIVVGIFMFATPSTGMIEVPVYPGAQKIDEGENSYLGVKISLYTFSGSGTDVYNWYESNMPVEGWIVYGGPYEYIPGVGGSFLYAKGNEGAFICIYENFNLSNLWGFSFVGTGSGFFIGQGTPEKLAIYFSAVPM